MYYTYNTILQEDNSLRTVYANHNTICYKIYDHLENDSLQKLDFRPTALSETHTMGDEAVLSSWEQYMQDLEQKQMERALQGVPHLNNLCENNSCSHSTMEVEKMEEEPVSERLEISPVLFTENGQGLLSDEEEIMIEVNDSDCSLSTADPGSPPLVHQFTFKEKVKQIKMKPTKGSGKKLLMAKNIQKEMEESNEEEETEMIWIWNHEGSVFQQIPYLRKSKAQK